MYTELARIEVAGKIGPQATESTEAGGISPFQKSAAHKELLEMVRKTVILARGGK